ncbi:MAG TPA: TIGR01459 family HAD-type hydrolase, partial [Rickettsiales bacterium]|nr:TIGR01459 family HAD-type hydrolase [Rickettsiales bacterium]
FYKRVDTAQSADFVLVTGFEGQHSTLEEKLLQIRDARKYDLPFLCVNPDMLVVRKDGTEMLCAGVLAREYEKMGGEVVYYGKPYKNVYDITYKLFSTPNKNKILAIGDGLETDIKGANDFGIDSVLVTSGILCNKLNIKFGEKTDEKKLNKICSLQKIFPCYVITNL